jgi:hypothetical protein
MTTCPHCGERNREGRETCRQCGGKLLPIERIMQQDERVRQAVGVLAPAVLALKGAAIGGFGGFWIGTGLAALLHAGNGSDDLAAGVFLLVGLLGAVTGAALGAFVGWLIVRKT